MKLFFTFSVFILLGLTTVFASVTTVDTLRKQLLSASDSIKGLIYTQIAAEYLHYDTIENNNVKLNFQNEAIANTLKALHYYSRYNDSIGLRTSFNTLAKVYLSQRKYSQAKWFILQSNTLSRVKNDTANIITSLLVLATVKTDIKDYDLAMQDLNSAMILAGRNAIAQSRVQLGYVLLYNNMQNYTKADIALRRYNFINDSIQRGEEARIIATADSTQRKIVAASDSIQHKKKSLLTNSKRLLSVNSSGKTDLL